MQVFVVIRNKKHREFRRIFMELSAAQDYIKAGKAAGVIGATQEFIEEHVVRET